MRRRGGGRRRRSRSSTARRAARTCTCLGGIAERYTCSEETIGYFGIDRWDTVGGTVETLPWNDPANWPGKTYDPPVSDYTATLLADKASIVIIGGQTAAGDLVGMGSVQVFNTSLRSWLSKVRPHASRPAARPG